MAFPARDYSSLVVPVTPVQPSGTPRAQRRPPMARMPGARDDWRMGSLVSVLAHLLLLLLLITPFAMTGELRPILQGAGGPGPAGGGGGSSGGEGFKREMLSFVRVAAALAPPTVAQLKVVVPPPKPQPQQPPAPVVPTPVAAATAAPATPTAGGQEAGGGAGPGSGGGVGSGAGTGTGSANGTGTGGGTQADYPPQPDVIFLPPLPAPGSVQGFHLTAQFDVDSTGRVLSLNFTPTPDGGYNRRLREALRGIHFRPGTHPDGTPIRMIAQIKYDF